MKRKIEEAQPQTGKYGKGKTAANKAIVKTKQLKLHESLTRAARQTLTPTPRTVTCTADERDTMMPDALGTTTPQPQTHLLLNVRGLSSNVKDVVTDIQTCETLTGHLPNSFTFTETKLFKCQTSAVRTLKKLLPEYAIWSSGPSRPNTWPRTWRGHSGVVVGILRRHIPAHVTNDAARVKTPLNLHGHILHIRIPATQGPVMNIIGVYAPTHQDKRKERAAVLRYVQGIADEANEQHEGLLLLGDWNAVSNETDRWAPDHTPGMNNDDKAFTKMLRDASLSPIEGQQQHRTPTSHQIQKGRVTHASRIDDVLTLAKTTQCVLQTNSLSMQIFESGSLTDHKALVCGIAHTSMHLPEGAIEDEAEQQRRTRAPRIALPISSADLDKVKEEVAQTLSTEFEMVEAKLKSIQTRISAETNGGTLPSHRTRAITTDILAQQGTTVEELAAELTAHIQEASHIMMRICQKSPITTQRTYLPRKAQRTCKKTYAQLQRLKSVVVEAHNTRFKAAPPPAVQQENRSKDVGDETEEELNTLHDTFPTVDTNQDAWESWLDKAQNLKDRLHDQTKAVRKKAKQKALDRATKRFRKLLATRPRVGHRQIFNPQTYDQPNLRALRHPETGAVHTDAPGIVNALHTYFTNLMGRPKFCKTGAYLPDDTQGRDYPWERSDAPDKFTLKSTVSNSPDTPGLLHHILDPTTFTNCINHLPRNKQPGPDAVYNELLRALPHSARAAIHCLFAIMWATGTTPTTWKKSNTILLYKKDDATEAKNYRPIALANTLYKLWTRVVTLAAASHAEKHSIVSSCQEGFRKHRNTTRQLQNYLHVIEDAALTNQDLFVTYIDLSNAFNTVEHDRLLWVMYDMGLPCDLIDVVHNLYSDASTTISTPYGQTQPVPLNRGTIQGDTLSPFLFLLYIEPLLRWLHSGGHGYRYGCLQNQGDNARMNCPALAYADDLVVMANTKEEICHQWKKVKLYMKWSGMSVNAKKCANSCILHASQPAQQNTQVPEHIQRHLRIHMEDGEDSIPFLEPTAAYKYLGVWITLTLNWGSQLKEATAAARAKGEALARSLASPRQRIHVIKTCIRAALAYPLPVAPYTSEDVGLLDSCLCSITKMCLGLPRGLSNVAVLRDVAAGGLGVCSLKVDYTQSAGAALVRCMNDAGRLGRVGRALLNLQARTLGDIPVSELKKEARFYTILRQASLIMDQGLSLIDKGTEFTLPEHPLWNFAKLAAAGDGEDPTDVQIPAAILATLEEVGAHSVQDLLTQDKSSIMMARDLPIRFPGATRRHMVALNCLTLLVTGAKSPTQALAHTMADTLTPKQRLLPRLPLACNAYLEQQAVRPTRYLEQLTLKQTYARRGIPLRPPEAAQAVLTQQAPGAEDGDSPGDDEDEAGPSGRPRKQRKTSQRALAAQRDNKRQQERKRSPVRIGLRGSPTTVEECVALLSERESMCKATIPKKKMYFIYNEFERIKRAISWRLNSTGPANDRISTHQYLIEWGDTVIHENHLRAFLDKGYTPASPPTRYPTPDAPPHVKMVHVAWSPTWENDREGDPAFTAAREAYKRNADDATAAEIGAATPLLTRLDGGLDDLEKQGINQQDTRSWDEHTEARLAIAEHVQFDPNPRNPDSDINIPTSEEALHRIQVGRRMEGTPTLADTDTVFAYDPVGRCLGSIHTSRFWKLLQWILSSRARLAVTETPASVISRLLTRYTPTRKRPAKRRNFTLPRHFLETLCETGGASIERFATPLTAECQLYYSTHPQDKDVGSLGDPYSAPWLGGSVAVPPFEAAELEKAMRWAVASAEIASAAEVPSVTYLVMPAWEGSPHTQLASHPHVHVLESFKAGKFPLLSHTHPAQPPTIVRKYGITVYVVANEAGVRTILGGDTPAAVKAFRDAYEEGSRNDAAEHKITGPILPTCTWERDPRQGFMPRTCPDTPTPRKLRRIINKLGGTVTMAHIPQPYPPNNAMPEERLVRLFPAKFPLAQDPRCAIYTDGSCIKATKGPNTCTAAAYIPDPTATRSSQGTNAHIILVNPNGQGPTNTINRAELCGVAAALDHAQKHPTPTLTIFTDSLCSIHLIRKMLHEPHLLRESKHKPLLERIASMLVARSTAGLVTSVQKVPSHAGIVGNECADAAASSMAKGDKLEVPGTISRVSEGSSADPYSNLVWIGKVVEKEEGEKETFLVNDLTLALKKWVHKNCVDGFANADGIYARANATAAMNSDPKFTSAAWRSGSSTFRALLTAFKARWGQLYNQKLACRYRLATSSACPLCGGPDSAGHILGGCQHRVMKAMYIARHNHAVQRIQKLISKHSCMAAFYTVMDACSESDITQHGAHSTRIPRWVLPGLGDEERNKLRPDILIVYGHKGTAHNYEIVEMRCAQTEIYMMEIGYCPDTQEAERYTTKSKQHETLQQLLRQQGDLADLETVLLGTSGSIPKSLRSYLMDVHKIPTPPIEKLLNHLNAHAINTAHSITCKRRELERLMGRRQPSGPGHG
jgi:ribonuclease HI/exonuclease III